MNLMSVDVMSPGSSDSHIIHPIMISWCKKEYWLLGCSSALGSGLGRSGIWLAEGEGKARTTTSTTLNHYYCLTTACILFSYITRGRK